MKSRRNWGRRRRGDIPFYRVILLLWRGGIEGEEKQRGEERRREYKVEKDRDRNKETERERCGGQSTVPCSQVLGL